MSADQTVPPSSVSASERWAGLGTRYNLPFPMPTFASGSACDHPVFNRFGGAYQRREPEQTRAARMHGAARCT